ncbi:hypothetical protein DYB37_011591 [Aphanomyces astaci]|uniref:CCHC-type domain-containing protein n=1 Tax=Aphanomyces astaci TaxID=112090 RepID=A0A418FI56_APHAT|nr:hypothetical protein DYB37_011591 [Aphanomyces astaci]
MTEISNLRWTSDIAFNDFTHKYYELVRKLEVARDLIPESTYATKLLVLMPEQFQNTVLHINRSHSTQAKYKTLPGLINELRADHELQRFRAAAGQAPRTNDVAFQATVENTCFYCTKPGHVARQCRSKTGDMERVIYRKNINEHGRQQQNPPPNGYPRGGRNHNQRGGRAGRGGRGRGNNRHDHANNAAEDIFFLNEENSDEEIGCEVKIDMLNLNEDTNHDGEEQMVIFDSGVSSYMTGYHNILFDIEECPPR